MAWQRPWVRAPPAPLRKRRRPNTESAHASSGRSSASPSLTGAIASPASALPIRSSPPQVPLGPKGQERARRSLLPVLLVLRGERGESGRTLGEVENLHPSQRLHPGELLPVVRVAIHRQRRPRVSPQEA